VRAAIETHATAGAGSRGTPDRQPRQRD
jgi:hypothetical protein